ncbi:MAG TPA: glutathione peroxidase [Bryobacteraceae bacterium]|nr:glutathione peroxidase [Bryobacteraceae bacterium]
MKTTLGLLAMLTSSAFGASSAHEFTLPSIDGAPAPLSEYKGKVALLVNVASQCGYTPQYAGLQKLYERYKDKGFVVLGFPANDFGAQEPGTNEEIKTFCTRNYRVTFPMFSKISVKGSGQAPLYKFLTGSGGGEVQWNFTKFLIDGSGKVIGRFESGVEPDSAELIGAVEKALRK